MGEDTIIPRLHASGDFDGDGGRDTIEGEIDDGNSAGERRVKLLLDGGPRKIEVVMAGDFTEMIDIVSVPPELRGNSRLGARRAVEDALADEVCDAPDPSLAFLLDGKPRWVSGPPRMPRAYLYYEAASERWIFYKGHNHARDSHATLKGDFREMNRTGGLVLLMTAHGLVVTDEARTKHAWIYVTKSAQRKLRFPSVREAELHSGGHAIVRLTSGESLEVPLPK